MNNIERIKEGLEIAYKKLIEYKKYKKTPLIVSKDGKVTEIKPEDISIADNVYK